ncbi:MAG: hypothetical protein MST10_09020 [Lentisphaeria bacterium]|nr:hypothetical protein [Lentisphaeria bacterium]
MQRLILRHGQFLVIDLREWKLTLEKLYLELQIKKLALQKRQSWDKKFTNPIKRNLPFRCIGITG